MNKLDVWDAYWWDAWFDFSEGGAMRLKQHREDVKDLKMMADPHVQDIAQRYLRLIRMAEEALEDHDAWDVDQTVYEKRVLKDSGSPERDGHGMSD